MVYSPKIGMYSLSDGACDCVTSYDCSPDNVALHYGLPDNSFPASRNNHTRHIVAIMKMKMSFFVIFIVTSLALLGHKISFHVLCEEPVPDILTSVLAYFSFIELETHCPILESVLWDFVVDFITLTEGFCLLAVLHFVCTKISSEIAQLRNFASALRLRIRRLVHKVWGRPRDAPKRKKVWYPDNSKQRLGNKKCQRRKKKKCGS